ncbi:MAG: DUF2283 domain-containing protein [Crocosphaera sp.]|jgi:uncharacterized protein YuzE
MDSVKIYYDEIGQTLTVWFDDPEKEFLVEETEEEVLLIKDETGKLIGFERLNYIPKNAQDLKVELIHV